MFYGLYAVFILVGANTTYYYLTITVNTYYHLLSQLMFGYFILFFKLLLNLHKNRSAAINSEST